MLHNQEQNEVLSSMALEAIEDVIISGEISEIRESLEEFFLEWVQSEDDHEQEERIRRVFHYRVLLGILMEAERIKSIRYA